MAITLESIAAPGATPIAFNAASSKSFTNDYFKLAQGNISTRDRKTINILGLIYSLAALAGANYKNNHAGLIQDAQVYSGAISNLDRATADAALAWNAGVLLDGSLSSDVPTLLNEGRDLDNLAELELDRIIVLLKAQLTT